MAGDDLTRRHNDDDDGKNALSAFSRLETGNAFSNLSPYAENVKNAVSPLANNVKETVSKMNDEKRMVIVGLIVVVIMSFVGGISTTSGVNKLMTSARIDETVEKAATPTGSIRRVSSSIPEVENLEPEPASANSEPVPVPEPASEPEPAAEPIPEPVPESVPEPVPEPAAEPVPESAQLDGEPVTEPAQSDGEAAPEPAQSDGEAAPEPAQSDGEAAPETAQSDGEGAETDGESSAAAEDGETPADSDGEPASAPGTKDGDAQVPAEPEPAAAPETAITTATAVAEPAPETAGQTTPAGEQEVVAAPQNCEAPAPRDGVIINSLLGHLVPNMVQVAFAKVMGEKLCWPVLFRKAWIGVIQADPRGAVCLPNAGVAETNTFVSPELQTKLGITSSEWNDVLKDKNNNKQFEDAVNRLKADEMAFSVTDGRVAKEEKLNEVIDTIRSDTSKIQLLDAQGMFLHGLWTRGHEDKLKEWFTVDDSCCQTEVAEDTVVVNLGEAQKSDVASGAYHHILTHYNMTDRPILIIPKSKKKVDSESKKITNLLNLLEGKNVSVYLGDDDFDRLCVLSRAKTLILSSRGPHGQFLALVSGVKDVHYPLRNVGNADGALGIKAEGWKYHVLSPALPEVDQFDVSVDTITFPTAVMS